MATDNNNLYDTYTGVTENSQGTDGSSIDTGDLLRTFDFGEKVYKLTPEVDPLFSFVSRLRKDTTPDPEFKYAEERDLTHVRYGYVLGAKSGTVNASPSLSNYEAIQVGASDDATSGMVDGNDAGDTYAIAVGTDYKWSGNIASVYGNSNNNVSIGDSGTAPKVFVPGQILKIPLKTAKANSADTGISPNTYQTVKITSKTVSGEHAYLDVEVIGPADSAAYFTTYNPFNSNDNFADDTDREGMIDQINANLYNLDGTTLQSLRAIVVGTGHAMGSAGPDTFITQPISTGYGLTQIFKTSFRMDNTSRATEYKFNSDQWLQNWKKKLKLHKWDIAHAGLFGKKRKDTSGDDKTLYTQGVVDYIAQFGNQFELDYDTKGVEDFMDDLEVFLDPRYNNAKPTLFFCDTQTWAWTNKLSGLATNSIDQLNSNSSDTPFGYNFQSLGMKNFFGVNANVISTPAGTIKLVKNTHLDGTNVGILGVNLNNAKYRPLAGNNMNRDTKIYPAVNSLESTGVDYREDQILTEAGFEWSLPETHAMWTKQG